MAFKVVITRRAQNDLIQILDYISVDLSNPRAASDFLQKVEDATQTISEFPFSSQLYQPSFFNIQDIRFKVIGNYNMFYSVNEDDKIVEILTIIYAKRNIDEILNSI